MDDSRPSSPTYICNSTLFLVASFTINIRFLYFTGRSKLVYDRSAIFFCKNVLQGSETRVLHKGSFFNYFDKTGTYVDAGNVKATNADFP